MSDFFSTSLSAEIGGVRAPDSAIVRQAVDFARGASSPMLFNHVMRSYYLGRAIAGGEQSLDEEIVFLSAVLHDLGLTDAGRGPRRFEIEGADVARRFLTDHGFDEDRSWLVWDTIALHPWTDINLFKEPEARVAQIGIMADVVGAGLEKIDPAAVESVLAAFPRENFKAGFVELLMDEATLKPSAHIFHPVHMIAEHCCYTVPVPDARAMIDGATWRE